jgi:hypothetical protein
MSLAALSPFVSQFLGRGIGFRLKSDARHGVRASNPNAEHQRRWRLNNIETARARTREGMRKLRARRRNPLHPAREKSKD